MLPGDLHCCSKNKRVSVPIMNTLLPLLAVLILVIICVLAAYWLSSRPERGAEDDDTSHRRRSKQRGFPYEVRRHFLSPAELSFFHVLQGAVRDRAFISTKVNLADIFWVNAANRSNFMTFRNKVDRKHVDFLLCDRATMQPILGIELDDKSHEREDRQVRDAFVDYVFKAARLPLLHVPARRAYVVAELETQIAPYLPVDSPAAPTSIAANAVAPAVQPAQAHPVAAPDNAPRCPKCGSPMILRTVKTGPSAGKQFWGCSTYPNCRGIIQTPPQ